MSVEKPAARRWPPPPAARAIAETSTRSSVARSETLRFGEVRDFPLADLLDLPGAAEEEADLEGMAVADGFLWVVGSHGLKRKNAKPDRDHAENAKRLAKVTLDGNRRLLACLPIEPDANGAPCLVRQAKDGRRALRLRGTHRQEQE